MRKVTKAVIPAAGLGTRFLPATIAQPKEMLPIVDKPVIQFVIEEAVASGIRDILVVTGRSKRAIEDHFDPSYELEEALAKKHKSELLEELRYISNLANIHYVRQRRQLGLADAIYQGKTFAGDDPFAVLLGDTVIGSAKGTHNLSNMVKAYEESGKSVVAVEEVSKDLVSRYGIVSGPDQDKDIFEVDELIEKPEPAEAPSNLAIASRYIFAPGIFNLIEKTKSGKGGEIQITDTMKYLAKVGELLAYRIKGKRYDIGNKVDFVKTNIEFALERPDTRKEILSYIREIAEK